jgi:hypothetical protein
MTHSCWDPPTKPYRSARLHQHPARWSDHAGASGWMLPGISLSLLYDIAYTQCLSVQVNQRQALVVVQ